MLGKWRTLCYSSTLLVVLYPPAGQRQKASDLQVILTVALSVSQCCYCNLVHAMRTPGTVLYVVKARLFHLPKLMTRANIGVQGGTCLSCRWMRGWGSCWCWGRRWGASPPASLWRPASPTGPPLPAARNSKTLQAVYAKPWLLQVPCLPSHPIMILFVWQETNVLGDIMWLV